MIAFAFAGQAVSFVKFVKFVMSAMISLTGL